MPALDHLGDRFTGNRHGFVEVGARRTSDTDIEGRDARVEVHLRLRGRGGLSRQRCDPEHQGQDQQTELASRQTHERSSNRLLILLHH